MEGKVCLITGGSRGIGLACGYKLARHGAQVVLVGRNRETIESAACRINSQLGRESAFGLVCDVVDPASVRDVFQFVFKKFKRLDVLIANAGLMDDALIGMVTPELISRVYGANTFSLLYCAQYASRLMARQGCGSIVALSSVVGIQGHSGQSVYSGAKSAVIGTVRSLAKELAPQKIRVNAIAPGFIETKMTSLLPENKKNQALERIGLKRVGTTDEVADAVYFLASDLSRYVTGQVLGVDGGMNL